MLLAGRKGTAHLCSGLVLGHRDFPKARTLNIQRKVGSASEPKNRIVQLWAGNRCCLTEETSVQKTDSWSSTCQNDRRPWVHYTWTSTPTGPVVPDAGWEVQRGCCPFQLFLNGMILLSSNCQAAWRWDLGSTSFSYSSVEHNVYCAHLWCTKLWPPTKTLLWQVIAGNRIPKGKGRRNRRGFYWQQETPVEKRWKQGKGKGFYITL